MLEQHYLNLNVNKDLILKNKVPQMYNTRNLINKKMY
jgi:hypothetical protein